MVFLQKRQCESTCRWNVYDTTSCFFFFFNIGIWFNPISFRSFYPLLTIWWNFALEVLWLSHWDGTWYWISVCHTSCKRSHWTRASKERRPENTESVKTFLLQNNLLQCLANTQNHLRSVLGCVSASMYWAYISKILPFIGYYKSIIAESYPCR